MSYFLSPLSTMQFEDANGVPYSGAKLFCYQAGTTTKQATYQTSTGSANTNPIVLNSQGRPPYGIWTPAGQSYHYFLATSADTDPPVGAAIYELDNVASINDTTATATGSGEWIDSTLTPTYISSTSFSFAGDQTTAFTVGRKLKSTVTAGTAYSVVKSATYAASITTVVVVNISGTIDSGISAVYYGIISASNTSQVDIRTPRYLVATTANNADYTLTELSTSGDYKTLRYEDMMVDVYIPASGTNTGAVTYNINSLGAKSVVNSDGSALTAGQLQATYSAKATYDTATSKFYLIDSVSPSLLHGAVSRGARHAINCAPTDSSGLTALGGSTGAATVTTTAISATAPLVVNVSNVIYNGAMIDEIGYSTANLTWTGLSTNGTMYLYVDITEKTKALTTGSTTLAPVYGFGGTPSTASGQATFDYSKMQMFVGNGSTAPQARRLFVGEVTVSGNVVTVIKWYAVNKKYQSSQVYTKNTILTYPHNLGEKPRNIKYYLECTTIDQEYQVGDFLMLDQHAFYIVTTYGGFSTAVNTLNAVITIATSGIALPLKTTAPHDVGLLTDSSWKIHVIIE